MLVIGLFGGFLLGFNQSHLISENPNEDWKRYNREIFLDVPVDAHEPEWSKALAVHVDGKAEYRLPDKSRIDVLTDEYAVELDWLHKWHEGVGQALHYAELSGKEPVVAIGIKEMDYDREKLKLAKRVANKSGIGVWVVRAKD
jgi:hypothetical protein